MSLVIKPISKAQGNKFNIPKFLPQPPFRMVFVAPTNSGKTTTINNMLSKPIFGYKAVFKKNIFLFSPSSQYDEALDSLEIKEENTRNFLDEDFIDEITEDQKAIIQEHGKAKAPHLLFLFDDVVLQIKKTGDNALKRIFYYGRKYNISCMITTQKYKALQTDYRLNASSYIYFLNTNNKEKETITDDQPIDKETFHEIWNLAKEDSNYSFIYVNMGLPIKERYFINFIKHVIMK